ncbi:MAG TPA: asparagine synthase (glutamine-hydrolyzing) [Tepidisphaeraceae bacterium]|nr:asparagine synthase (glutamine-hydrolyzing) [Tepidisphaeraceae bacterium]
MCGICGFVGDDRPELIGKMSAAMSHRGPDDVGQWFDPESLAGLGHRRLAIIDLTKAGNQPMSNEDGSIIVTFNGEIYNYQNLRQNLIELGHVLQSNTDSEILVHLYEEQGEHMLEDLNGMFSFAIWDARQRKLFIARDHAGIKPLYYWNSGSAFYFASEIKALLRIPEIPRELNRDLIGQFLTFLWIPGRETMLQGIQKLEPGHCISIKNGRAFMRRWFSLNYEPDESTNEAEWIDRVHDTFLRVTRRQMVSDVPMGAFLSGGIDSSSLVACMREVHPGRPIECYTSRLHPDDASSDGFVDDYPYAQKVAKHLDVRLNEFVLRPDVTDLLPKMVWHLDEPDADPAVFPSYLIAQAARQNGTTALLSGMGGDEVFFGYRSHQALYQYEQLPRILQSAAGAVSAFGPLLGSDHPLVRRSARFRRGLGQKGAARHLALVDWSSPQTRSRLLGADDSPETLQSISRYFDSFSGKGELNRHSHVLIQTFLACHNLLYTDKSSMAASVEVRVPFLDLDLMRLCASIPQRHQMKRGVTKHILKQAMSRYLPDDVVHRRKTGFMAPLRKWIASDLDEMISEFLSEERLRERELFDPQAVGEILEENRAKRADHSYLIYALLTLECWMQTFIDRPGHAPVG